MLCGVVFLSFILFFVCVFEISMDVVELVFVGLGCIKLVLFLVGFSYVESLHLPHVCCSVGVGVSFCLTSDH